MSHIEFCFHFPQFVVAPNSDNRLNVVIRFAWQLIGHSHDGFQASCEGEVHLGAPSAESAFIEFEKLTAEDAERWTADRIHLPSVKQEIERLIEAQRTPKLIACIAPWEVEK